MKFGKVQLDLTWTENIGMENTARGESLLMNQASNRHERLKPMERYAANVLGKVAMLDIFRREWGSKASYIYPYTRNDNRSSTT